MIYLDYGEEEITKVLDPEFFAKASRRMVTDLEAQIAKTVFKELVGTRSEVPSEEAFVLLNKARLWLETYLLKMVSGYSSLRWLWMLRRTPHHVFSGGLPTTFGYDQALAEVLAAGSETLDLSLKKHNGDVYSYSLFGATIRRLAEFCAAARYVSDIHSSLRWSGKGASFSFQNGSRLVPCPDSALRESVKLYDLRTSESGTPLERSGTILGENQYDLENGPFILYVQPIEPRTLAVPDQYIPEMISKFTQVDGLEVRYRFIPKFVSLAPFTRLLKLTNEVVLWPREAMILILLLWGALRVTLRHRAGFLSLVTRGYLFLDEELLQYLYEPILAEYRFYFGDLFNQSTPPSSAHQFVEELRSIRGCSWPLRVGPVVRSEGQITAIDLRAASACLDAVLETSVCDGRVANIRSQHFELVTQDLIDRSSWRPSPEIKDIRGRTLRIAGLTITDVDAIGEYGDELLLVSCKSIIYSGEYDSGDFRAVRNAASVILNAVADWREKVSTIYSARRGDNFDFTKFSKIISVVCTPANVYVPICLATEEIRKGLRMAISVRELATWLGVKHG